MHEGRGEDVAAGEASFRKWFWATVVTALVTGIYRLIAGTVIDTPTASQQDTLNWAGYIAFICIGAIVGLFSGKRFT
jgi:thiamine transporter ThiT